MPVFLAGCVAPAAINREALLRWLWRRGLREPTGADGQRAENCQPDEAVGELPRGIGRHEEDERGVDRIEDQVVLQGDRPELRGAELAVGER